MNNTKIISIFLVLILYSFNIALSANITEQDKFQLGYYLVEHKIYEIYELADKSQVKNLLPNQIEFFLNEILSEDLYNNKNWHTACSYLGDEKFKWKKRNTYLDLSSYLFIVIQIPRLLGNNYDNSYKMIISFLIMLPLFGLIVLKYYDLQHIELKRQNYINFLINHTNTFDLAKNFANQYIKAIKDNNVPQTGNELKLKNQFNKLKNRLKEEHKKIALGQVISLEE